MRSDGLTALPLPPVPTRGVLARRTTWAAAWFGVIAAVDLWRWKKDDQTTLSDSFRHAFQVESPIGRLAFLASVAIFVRHILK